MTLSSVTVGVALALVLACAGVRGGAVRVSGGEEVAVEAHPYMAQLLRDEAGGGGFQFACAGAILTASFTLSAASCFHGTAVAGGAWRGRFGSSSSAFGGSVVVIFSVAAHPDYSPASLQADVAVARVQVALAYGAGVAPGVFAAPTTLLPDGAALTLLGWGALDAEGAWSQWLQAASVVTLSAAECARVRGEAPGQGQFCTGAGVGAGAAAGACERDVGAPLVAGGVVVGVTAAPGGCGGGGEGAALNTLVPAVIDWVSEYTQSDQ